MVVSCNTYRIVEWTVNKGGFCLFCIHCGYSFQVVSQCQYGLSSN